MNGAIRCAFPVSSWLLSPASLWSPPPARPTQAAPARSLPRLANANQWRDHVMIVAHRGGWKENGSIVMAENSIAGVNASIALGVEIVELDVQASKDDQFIVMHDTWLDRTTTCRGLVAERTVTELKSCRLVVEGTGAVTGERVSTRWPRCWPSRRTACWSTSTTSSAPTALPAWWPSRAPWASRIRLS